MVFILSMSFPCLYMYCCFFPRFSRQPTSMRAIRARYDPYLQTRHRVEQVGVISVNFGRTLIITIIYRLAVVNIANLATRLSCMLFLFCLMQLKQLGHSVDKVEFIVMGGTFMSLPEDYRDYFIRNLHDALSGHTSNNVAEAVRSAAVDLDSKHHSLHL